LYPGNQTSEKSLFKTIEQVEALLPINDRHHRGGVLIRLDAGFGNDQNMRSQEQNQPLSFPFRDFN
jgi:hypothetical protein